MMIDIQMTMFEYIYDVSVHFATMMMIMWNYKLYLSYVEMTTLNMELLSQMKEETKNNIELEECSSIPSDYTIETYNDTMSEISELSLDIDFDEASRAWRSNKQCIGDGQFEYIEETRKRAIPEPTRRYYTRSQAKKDGVVLL